MTPLVRVVAWTPQTGNHCMSETITYRTIDSKEAPAVSALILESFNEFIRREFSELGISAFHKYVLPDAIAERVRRDHFVVVADTGNVLAGMIEIRQNNHVGLLFVGKSFQKRGIARELLSYALGMARTSQPNLERVTVNSSRYGVAAYERLGFRQTGPERIVNGIVFIPMALQFTDEA